MDAILDAAARVVQTHGDMAATTNRIAVRAGVSIGSLYEYFPSKDAILIALARRHMEANFAVVDAMLKEVGPHAPLREVLTRLVGAMVRSHEENPELHRVLFEETPLPGVFRREIAEAETSFIAVVAGLIRARGTSGASEPEISAYVVVNLVEALTHRFVLYPPASRSAERFTQEVVTVIASYLDRVQSNGIQTLP